MPLYQVIYEIYDKGNSMSPLAIWLNAANSNDAATRAQTLAEIISPSSGDETDSMILGVIQRVLLSEPVDDIDSWAIQDTAISGADSQLAVRFMFKNTALDEYEKISPATFNPAFIDEPTQTPDTSAQPVIDFLADILSGDVTTRFGAVLDDMVIAYVVSGGE